MAGMGIPFFTIGHSTHPVGEFIDMLAGLEIALVADVRTVPRSRTNPQFNADAFAETLASRQIGYEHIAALGGLRPRSRDIGPEVNAFWKNQSFHNYADYAMTEGFRSGLARLRELGSTKLCAVMCAEAVWWRCHRRIIADYLLAGGDHVFHIMAAGKTSPASLTPGAHVDRNGTITYPAR